MGGDNEKKQNESEKKERADFPTLSKIGAVEEIGSQIGPYKLLSILGKGGMGLVYLAEQKEPVKRRVALKIIKPGMDSEQVIGRFEQERQALALLDHPNIAHIYDGGTTEAGHPYFVMEYVKGSPITEYCDKKELKIEERLDLFEQVCEAVQHAHQKGIIHRDLKPSNILVREQDGKPVPMIIDFGIAKATQPLTERAIFTELGEPIGTVEYMSPEQAEMTIHGIDTRSDIYSLGVVLYELLTGALPFTKEELEQAGRAEIHRIIREADPPRPSTRLSSLGKEAQKIARCRQTGVWALAKRLHKELEWIPLKAMRKEPDRRYKTASELADDVRNYLHGDPLIAGPESVAYRTHKLVRRHKRLIAGAMSILAVLVLGFIVSTTMYLRAEKARRSVAETAERLRVASYFDKIHLANQAIDGRDYSCIYEILTSCPNDLRDWEWHYLWHAASLTGITLAEQQERAYPILFSPDGRWVVSGSESGSVMVWDLETRSKVKVLVKHESFINALAISPDGRRVASASADGTVKLWDVVKGSLIDTIVKHDTPVLLVSFDPKGERIVLFAEDGTLMSWDAASGIKPIPLQNYGVVRPYMEAFSPDTKLLFVSEWRGRQDKVWDTATGLEMHDLTGTTSPVIAAAFNHDNQRLIISGGDGKIRVFSGILGDDVSESYIDGDASKVTFGPDDNYMVLGDSAGRITLWDASDPNQVSKLREFRAHRGQVGSISFSPDGRLFASSDRASIKVWKRDPQDGVRTFTVQKGVRSISFSPDGSRVALCGVRCTSVLDVASGHLELLDGPSRGAVFSQDSKSIMIIHWEAIRFLDIPEGTERRVLPIEAEYNFAAVTPNREYVSTIDENDVVRMRDLRTEAELWQQKLDHGTSVRPAFSPDGRHVIVDVNEGTVRIRDSKTGAEVLKFDGPYGIGECVFSPDGKYIVSRSWQAIVIWSAETGLFTCDNGGDINAVAFNPSGTRVVSGGEDGRIRFWDMATRCEVLTLDADSSVVALTFSPDGRMCAACANGAIKIWDIECNNETAVEDEAAVSGVDPARHRLVQEIDYWTEHLDRNPADAATYESRALAYLQSGEYSRAITDYHKAMEMDPNNVSRLKELAWLHATSGIDKIRNGPKAVELAMKACKITDYKDYTCIDTLAAAYAESGNFQSAIKWQETAISLLEKDEPRVVSFWRDQYSKRLKLYQSGKPYREQ